MRAPRLLFSKMIQHKQKYFYFCCRRFNLSLSFLSLSFCSSGISGANARAVRKRSTLVSVFMKLHHQLFIKICDLLLNDIALEDILLKWNVSSIGTVSLTLAIFAQIAIERLSRLAQKTWILKKLLC